MRNAGNISSKTVSTRRRCSDEGNRAIINITDRGPVKKKSTEPFNNSRKGSQFV